MLNKTDVHLQRLTLIREALKANGFYGIIVPRFDAHMAEYIAPCDRRLEWATGFSGSAGVALITQDEAIMFVDGRYTVQVREQCPSQYFCYRHLHDEPLADWFAQFNARDKIFAYDPMHVSVAWFDKFKSGVDKSRNNLVAMDENIIDQLWDDQPAPSSAQARPFGEAMCGEHSVSKRTRLATELSQHNIDLLVENQPDNIAWLLNIRGDDIAYNPFVNSFLTLSSTGDVNWFVDAQKVPQDRSAFELDGVNIRDRSEFLPQLEQHAAGQKISIDPAMTPIAVKFATEGAEVVNQISPITMAKAKKNEVELKGMRDCHRRDGVAWLRLDHWLANEVRPRAEAGNPITELEVANQIEKFRSELSGFEQLSFDVISGAGPNGAMCHYKVSEKSNRAILPDDVYLHDSGGQYVDGTTDSTRTYIFSKPAPDFAQNYTAVLKGFIGLANVAFPKKTYGHHLDAIARAPLWALGKDYDHGTGHGVGHNLSVHEQPQRIGRPINEVELVPGMVLSNEPGYYVAGEYGIRIENLFEIVMRDDGFLKFETLSLIPIPTAPIVKSMLTNDEITWFNAYHQKVREALQDQVTGEVKDYLMRVTAAI
jgi:Xaa-Pro aminopeptidase